MIGLYDCDTDEVHYRDYKEMPGHIVGKTVKCHIFKNNCDVWVEFDLKDNQAHVISVYPEKPVEPRSPWQDIWDLFNLQNERRSSHELKVWLEKTYNLPEMKKITVLIGLLILSGCNRSSEKTIYTKDYATRHACICNYSYYDVWATKWFQDSCHKYNVGDTIK